MKKKTFIKLAVLIVLIFLYLIGLKMSAHLLVLENQRIAIIQGVGYKGEEAARKVDELYQNSVVSVMWTSYKNRMAENQNLNKTSSVEQIKFVGDVRLLYSKSAPVNRNVNGCAIDKGTAFQLFGSTDVLGEVVTIAQESYIIQSIIETSNQVIVCQASSKDIGLNRITISKDKFLSYSELKQIVSVQLGMDAILIKMDWLLVFSRMLLLLFPTFVIVKLLHMIIQDIPKSTARIRILYIAIIGILALLFWFGILKYIKVPSEMIINKLSEFEKWAVVWKDVKRELLLLVSVEKGGPILEYWRYFYKSCVCSILILFAFKLYPKVMALPKWEKTN